MRRFEGRLLNLDIVDACNRKWDKNCNISYPHKIPVMWNFGHDVLGIAEISEDVRGLICKGAICDEIPAGEYYTGGYYVGVDAHMENDVTVIDSCNLVGMSIISEDKAADKKATIWVVNEYD